jgi:hypothetical protein
MSSRIFQLVFILLLIITRMCLGQMNQEIRTTVVSLAGEDILHPCEYRLLLPD